MNELSNLLNPLPDICFLMKPRSFWVEQSLCGLRRATRHESPLQYALQIWKETFLEAFDIAFYKNDPRDDIFYSSVLHLQKQVQV